MALMSDITALNGVMQLGFVYIYIRYYTININNTPLIVCHLYWQGLQDDYRTYCGVICFSEEGKNNV